VHAVVASVWLDVPDEVYMAAARAPLSMAVNA
jgi:hypothetical protein